LAEVLVVATPCPLLIAAPVSFIAGMSRAARAGIIVKDGGTLERLARVRTVAFDKTGTLTHGTPRVARVLPAGRTDDELLALVASAEQLSNHVLARALVDEAAARGLTLATDVTVDDVPGRGLRARVGGHHLVLGSYALVADTAVDMEREALAPGEMSVVVSVDGRYAGTVTLSDEVRDDAARTVSRLRDAGVERMVVLTGDGQATAEAVAAQVGLDEVRAGLLPQGKVDAVAGLAGAAGTSGRPVMMVGDGLNDAPVLAVSDVGVAMGARGATAASESADVVVLVDELARVADAVAISRRTVRVALQSIGLGIGLSLVLMVLAALGAIPAVVGAGLQEVVDLVAILNALRALGGPAGETDGRRSGRAVASGQQRAGRRDDVLV
jgi:heavy metal translocating P-type ATPase